MGGSFETSCRWGTDTAASTGQSLECSGAQASRCSLVLLSYRAERPWKRTDSTRVLLLRVRYLQGVAGAAAAAT